MAATEVVRVLAVEAAVFGVEEGRAEHGVDLVRVKVECGLDDGPGDGEGASQRGWLLLGD